MSNCKVLYLGTDPSRYERPVVHCPLIETRLLPLPEHIIAEWDAFTHVILTSPNAARILADQVSLTGKAILVIGEGTEAVLQQMGLNCLGVATTETQEGVVELLERINLKEAYLLYPRSSMARPLLGDFLRDLRVKCQICDLYETVFLRPDPAPSLEDFNEIVFTSPSTVRAFIDLYGVLPIHKKLTCIGPITKDFLNSQLK